MLEQRMAERSGLGCSSCCAHSWGSIGGGQSLRGRLPRSCISPGISGSSCRDKNFRLLTSYQMDAEPPMARKVIRNVIGVHVGAVALFGASQFIPDDGLWRVLDIAAFMVILYPISIAGEWFPGERRYWSMAGVIVALVALLELVDHRAGATASTIVAVITAGAGLTVWYLKYGRRSVRARSEAASHC